MNALLLVVAMLSFDAPQVVSDFMRSDAFVRVIHGPVGSGKSSGSVVEIVRRALEQKPHNGVRDTRFVIVRNTYRELEDTTRKTFESWLGGLGRWREADFAFEIDKRLQDGTRVKCEVLFRALDKPQDVKKLLSLEVTGAYINELREVPKIIFDGLQMRVGRYPAAKDGGPTWYGVWGDTNPWPQDSEYAELFASCPEGFELFRQPSGLAPDAENIEHLPGGIGYYHRMSAGKDSSWVDEYVKGLNPKSDKGAIYGEWLVNLRQRGSVLPFPHPTDGVVAVFDLGVSDSTAIWWFRIGPGGTADVIDWHEASGFGASHYIAILKGQSPEGVEDTFVPKKYDLLRVFLPHDGAQREFQSGVSTISLFEKSFPNRVSLVNNLGVADGIGAGRWLLEQPIRIHSRCEPGLKRLGAYRYEWDPDKKVFKRTPRHDWTSHTADAWRYLAEVFQRLVLMTKPAEAAKPPPGRTIRVTLDEALTIHDSESTQHRRL